MGLKSILSEGKAVAGTAWRQRSRSFPVWFGRVLLFSAIVALAFCFDPAVAALAPINAEGFWPWIAGRFSYWGDFPTGTIPLSLGLIGLGVWRKQVIWRRAGWAALLAATVAGALVISFRVTLGRPRPYATRAEAVQRLGRVPAPWLSFGTVSRGDTLPDGFYGPLGVTMLQGFPSGHAATSVATAAALCAALPPVGAVVALGAVGVCGSRIYLRRHHLSDVCAGGAVGLLIGVAYGRAARKQ